MIDTAQAEGKPPAATVKPRPVRPQLYDTDGHRLPAQRSPIIGQPRLARPSWHRLVVDRWQEVVR